MQSSLRNTPVNERPFKKAGLAGLGGTILAYLGVFALYIGQDWPVGKFFNECLEENEINSNVWHFSWLFGGLVMLMAFLTILVDIKLHLLLKSSVSPMLPSATEDGDQAINIQESIKIPLRAGIVSTLFLLVAILVFLVARIASFSFSKM